MSHHTIEVENDNVLSSDETSETLAEYIGEVNKDYILTGKGMVLTPEKTQSMIADWMGKKAAIPTEQVGDYTVLPANVEALREAGLTDEQIAQLDLRNGGNVDENGNVLFLDTERLARKEHPNQPMYENAPDMTDGVPAMWDYIAQNLMEAKPANWEMVKQEFAAIAALSATTNDRPGESTAKEFELGMGLGGSTHGVMLPLNIDLTDDARAQSTTVPIDLIDQAIDMAEFIGGMQKCVCRDKEQCEDYPIDCACLFFNMAGKMVVNQEYCIGCGLCKKQCPEGAIRIQQTMPMRESIHEHFMKEARIDLVIDKCTVE